MQKFSICILVALLVVGIWAFPKIKALNTMYHLFDENQIVENFRSVKEIWPTRQLNKAAKPYRYAQGERLSLPLTLAVTALFLIRQHFWRILGQPGCWSYKPMRFGLKIITEVILKVRKIFLGQWPSHSFLL